jgi:predicted transcriptional regulator
MDSKEKLLEINKKLPHGCKKKIAEKSGFSNTYITQFFTGAIEATYGTTKAIINATNEVLKDYKKERNELNMMIDKINI